MHPTVIITAYRQALEDTIEIMREHYSRKIDVTNREDMLGVVKSCVGTKFISKWSDLACEIALDAVSKVTLEENGRKEIDIKRYAKVEKIPGELRNDISHDLPILARYCVCTCNCKRCPGIDGKKSGRLGAPSLKVDLHKWYRENVNENDRKEPHLVFRDKRNEAS